LIANHHGIGIDGMIPYNMAIRLITSAVVGTEDDDVLLYFKGYVKNENG